MSILDNIKNLLIDKNIDELKEMKMELMKEIDSQITTIKFAEHIDN
jgi:hypothetical protein